MLFFRVENPKDWEVFTRHLKIGNWHDLSMLDLRYSEKYLPEGFETLVSLEKLVICQCHNLKKLPDSICNFKKLRELTFGGGRSFVGITALPDHIGQISSLKILEIHETCIAEIPETIGNLYNLESLLVNSNSKLYYLPESIGKLHSLQLLDLEYQYLKVLPNSIGELKNLKELNLEYSQIDRLPETIGNLTNLETLNIMNNRLETLPETIGNLANLRTLYYSYGNPLKSLPLTFSKIYKKYIDIF